MRLLLITLFAFPLISQAKTCIFELDKESLKLEWTAFKTPLKVGVTGSFDKLGVDKNVKATSLPKMLTGIPFNIDTKTINTANPDRDKKIYNFFFKSMKGSDSISGKILTYKKKTLNVLINMNGKEMNIPLKVDSKDDSFIAEGHIDVLDFALASNLAEINKACLELHEGKTWSDVSLKLSGKYSKSCK